MTSKPVTRSTNARGAGRPAPRRLLATLGAAVAVAAPAAGAAPPSPAAPIPRNPDALAAVLGDTTVALRAAIADWNVLAAVNAYVDAVLRYARRISADRTTFYGLYCWQVFVKTPGGDRRVTGPGLP